MIVGWGSKGACNDTGFTPNAFVFIDDHPLVFNIAVASLRGANLHAERLLTILAGHREIESDILIFDHPDS
jgi:hypothetical protein